MQVYPLSWNYLIRFSEAQCFIFFRWTYHLQTSSQHWTTNQPMRLGYLNNWNEINLEWLFFISTALPLILLLWQQSLSLLQYVLCGKSLSKICWSSSIIDKLDLFFRNYRNKIKKLYEAIHKGNVIFRYTNWTGYTL